jgi:predicted SpoU family rRNA methylase
MGPIDESIRFAGGEIEVVPSERAKRVRNSVEE